MDLQTLIAVEDLLLEKEIKAILLKNNLNYENQINIDTNSIDWAKFKNELRSEGDEKQIILCFQKPKIIYNSALDLLENNNLEIIFKWICKFNKIHQNIFQLAQNKKIKLMYITTKQNDENDFVNTIINNYIWKYYEGLLMETTNYGVDIGIMFRNANESFWTYTDHLISFLKNKNPNLFTNISKKELNNEIISRNKVEKNKVINWGTQNKKKIAVITGASGGIGLAIGKYLIQKNWKVYSLSRQGGINHGIIYIKTDLKNSENMSLILNEIVSKEQKIDLLINNSGFGIASSLENLDEIEFEEMYRINVLSCLKLTKILIPILNKSKGWIVNIGSVAGIFTIPFQVAYSLTKVLIDVYSQIILKELNEKNIQITTLMPGDTKSNFTKNRRFSIFDKNTKYEERILQSIKIMEKDEKNGHKAEFVAKSLYKNLIKENFPIRFTVGKYKLLFKVSRILSPNQINKMLNKTYSAWSKNND